MIRVSTRSPEAARQPDDDPSAVEAARNRRFVREYLDPVLRQHFASHRDALTVLSDGCGVGAEVEALHELGYQAVGIEPGIRQRYWRYRSCQDALIIADGVALPFLDESFDAVLSFGVLDHVGTVIHSRQLHPQWAWLRRQYVHEMLRVTKPGGAIIVGVINRLCPIDPFHAPNFLGFRFHGPWDRYSISWNQLQRWSCVGKLCCRIETLPFNRRVFAWDGLRSRWWGRLLFHQILATIEFLFATEACKPLRASWLNPFLLVKITK